MEDGEEEAKKGGMCKAMEGKERRREIRYRKELNGKGVRERKESEFTGSL